MDMIERVATAIVASIKAQMDGHPIPGVPPSVDSWTATGGVIDGSILARAAIEALPLKEWLAAMERDWYQIAVEFGYPDDTIEKDIAAGRAPEIAQLRELLAALTSLQPQTPSP